MKFLISFLFILIFFNSPKLGATVFESIQIPGWIKEQLSVDHLRFLDPARPAHVIHLQVDSYDLKNHWSLATLHEDIQKMEKMRNNMAFFMGLKEYKITNAQLKNNILDLEGSYIRSGNHIVVFREINFYHANHFLQFKIISDSTPLTNEELSKIVNAINPDKVDID